MDSRTFFEEQKKLGLTKEQAVKEAELYEKTNGRFDDLKPPSFFPKQTLTAKPINDLRSLYRDMITEGESYNIEERAKAINFLASKTGRTDQVSRYEHENTIARVTGAKSIGAINYAKFNEMMLEDYKDYEDEEFLPFNERYERIADIPESELNRKKEDSNYSSNSLVDDIVDSLEPKFQAILNMKDKFFAEDFYNDVVEGKVGRPTPIGGIAKGSASLYDQYRHGAWMNWYNHNLALAYNSKDFDRFNELRSMKTTIEKESGSIFNTENKNIISKGITGVVSGIAPLAVEAGLPALAMTAVGGGKLAAGYSAYYMQQMGQGIMLDNYFRNRDETSLSSEEINRVRSITAGAGVAYAAVERAVGAIPFLKLGTRVDKKIADVLINKFMKEGIPNKTTKTLIQGAIRTGIEGSEEGIQKGLEIGTDGILSEMDVENRKYAIQELTANFDKYFNEEAISGGIKESLDALPSIAIFGLIGMPMDYRSFVREENTVNDRIKFLQINGRYSREEAERIAKDSLLDNKKGKEARIDLATENFLLAGVADVEKARDFATRQENAKNTKNAKDIDTDVTEELLNEIANTLSIKTLVEWDQARGLAERLVNAKTQEEAIAVQDEIFEGLRQINLEQRRLEFIQAGFTFREANKKALQISNNFNRHRKKLKEDLANANTAREEITLFGLANARSFSESLDNLPSTIQVYEEAAIQTQNRVNEAKKHIASPFAGYGLYSRGDFADIRRKYSDIELKELFRGFSNETYEMFIDAINETGTSSREAQMRYNKYIMNHRNNEYKRWLNFNNLRDSKFNIKEEFDEETKKAILAGEMDTDVLAIMGRENITDIKKGRQRFLDIGQTVGSSQGRGRVQVRKPTRSEMNTIENQTKNALNSIKEILPDTKIIYHYTNEDFIEANGFIGNEAYKGNEVHINLEQMTKEKLQGESFVAHGVGHNIVATHIINNPVLQSQLMDLYEEIKPSLSEDVVAGLEKHIEKYKGESYIPEEYIIQLLGVMAENVDLLDKPLSSMDKFNNTIKSLLGKMPVKEETMADMLLNVARSISEGNILTQEDVAFLRTDLSQYTLPELQTYAQQLKLNTEGTEQELIERINENIQYTGRNNADNIMEVSRLQSRHNKLEEARIELSKRNEYYNTNNPRRVENVDQKIALINKEIKAIEDRVQELIQMRASKVVIESPQFQEKFTGSVVTTDLNQPKVMFHATNVLFEEFDPNKGDGGFHVGNVFQANKRMESIQGLNDYERIYPLYVNIKNPLHMEDIGAWSNRPKELRKELLNIGITLQQTEKQKLAEKQLDDYFAGTLVVNGQLITHVNNELESVLLDRVKEETTKTFIKTVKDLGYDGVIYKNTFESEFKDDPDESYIAFDKEQLIPAYGVPTHQSMSSKNVRASKVIIPESTDNFFVSTIGMPRDDVDYDNFALNVDSGDSPLFIEDLLDYFDGTRDEDITYNQLQKIATRLPFFNVNRNSKKEILEDAIEDYLRALKAERVPVNAISFDEQAYKKFMEDNEDDLYAYYNDDGYDESYFYFLMEEAQNIKFLKKNIPLSTPPKLPPVRREIDEFQKPDEQFLKPLFADQIFDILEGKITPEEYVEIVRRRRGDMSYKSLPLLPTDRAIKEAVRGDKKEKVGKENSVEEYVEGEVIESRLDIPAYKDRGVYVVTIHKKRAKGADKSNLAINYIATVRLKNVTFEAPVSLAARIGTKNINKTTVATMRGKYVSGGTDAGDVKNYMSAEDYLNDSAWTQIGYNPYLASYFWTRKGFDPVVSADEVVQIGGLVFAKNVKTSSILDPRFLIVPKNKSDYDQAKKNLDKLLGGRTVDPDARFSKVVEPTIDLVKDQNVAEDNFFFVWESALDKQGSRFDPESENFEEAAVNALEDMEEFIANNPKYLDYYEKDWQTTRNYLNAIFDKKITDEEFEFYRVVIGLTSPNTLLPSNVGDAIQLLNMYITDPTLSGIQTKINPKTGRVQYDKEKSTLILSSTTNSGKAVAIKAFLKVVEQQGSVVKAVEYLKEPVSFNELKQFNKSLGYKSDPTRGALERITKIATGQSELLPRMLIFGKKVGAYTLNSVGETGYTTTDIWESRFIRSYFNEMFSENTGLPVSVAEDELFQEFSAVFNKEFNQKYNKKFTPAALQAIRWFYIINSFKRAGYKNAKTAETISTYTIQKAKQYLGRDITIGGQSDAQIDEKIRASKVTGSVDDNLRRDVRSRILAFQKLREGGEVETEDGTVYEQGQTSYDTTKIAINRARKLILGEEPTESETQSVDEWIEQAIARYDATGRRILLANLIRNPRILNGVERHALAIHKMNLEEKLERINRELDAQKDLENNELAEGLQSTYTDTLREYDSLLMVLKNTATSWGRAGVAIRVTKRADFYSSVNLIAQAEIAKNEKLTYEERKEIASFASQIDKADKKVAKLELENLRASEKARNDEANEFLQTIAKRKKRKLDDILEERRLILIAIADLGYTIPEKFTGRASKQDIDSARLAHQIYKLSKNYIESGVNTLEGVVNAVQKILPHVERNLIIQILAERSTKSTKSKSKIAKQMEADLSRAKEILGKIERLKAGIFDPKRVVQRQDSELKRLKQELKYLQRVTVDTEADDAKAEEIYNLIERIIDGVETVETQNLPPQAKTEKLRLAEQQLREVRRLKRTEAKMDELKRIIREDDYEALSIPSPKQDILNEDLKQATIELAKLEAEVKNRVYALRKKTTYENVSDVMGLPRAILASTDMSYALRQGLIVSAGHPIIAGKAFVGALKSAFSENQYRLIDKGIKSNSKHALRVHYGLYFSSIDAPLLEREEMFATNLLDKIANLPVIKQSGAGLIIKTLKGFSERNMVTGLNLLRAGLFDKFVEDAQKAGVQLTDQELEAYAKYINVATGRGDLYELAGAAQALSQVLFSPRFTFSRVQAPLYAIKNLTKSKRLRNEMLRQWVSMFAVAMSVMALAKEAGAEEVDDDPESPFFGKLVINNVVIDIFGGLLQPFRVLAITLKAGHVNWIEKDDRFVDMKGVAGKFFKSKLAPPFGIGYELISGKDWMWDSAEAEPLETIKSSFIPLTLQTALDIYENDIPLNESLLMSTEFFGIGNFYMD